MHYNGWRHTKKVSNVLSRCYAKRRMGVCGRSDPSFDMTPTLKTLKSFELKKSKMSLIPKEGWAWPCAPILLLV